MPISSANAAGRNEIGPLPRTNEAATPVTAVAARPPTAPDQVFPGEILGAKSGPPIARPVMYAPMSLAQTISSNTITLAPPLVGGCLSQTSATAATPRYGIPNASGRTLEMPPVRPIPTIVAAISSNSASTGWPEAAKSTETGSATNSAIAQDLSCLQRLTH